MTASEKTNQWEVDVETREFEYHVKNFLGLSEANIRLRLNTFKDKQL